MTPLARASRLASLAAFTALLAGCPGPTPASDAGRDATASDAAGDATPTPGDGARDAPAVPCGNDPWITYGHDARRTFATDACVPGALAMAWRYDPTPPMMRTITAIFHAVVGPDGAYLQWRASNMAFLGTTAVDKVSPTGTRVWTFDTGTDTNLGNWASLALGSLAVQDDGLYFLDPATGMRQRDTGVDWWGQTAPGDGRLYVVQNAHIDGPGVFVGAVDAMGHPIWQRNQYGMCRIDVTDINGAMAIDGGTLFYAPRYVMGMGVTLPFASGVYAFDAAMGTPRWNMPTTPSSAVSAGDGRVYLIENGNTLVARNQSNGAVAWMAAVMGASVQAPVLAAGLVIVASGAGVHAFRADTGAPAWNAMLAGAAASPTTTQFTGGCAGLVAEGGPITTTMAAALGSNTLLVTAGGAVHVLALADGIERGQTMVAGAMGAVHDPVPVGNTVYVVDGRGLIALHAM